jgi:hypothetical protein
MPVLAQYLQIRSMIQGTQLHPSRPDKIVWRWTASGLYSSASAYRMLLQVQCCILGAKEAWESMAPGKCRFFAWQVLHMKIWTSERLLRHGLPNSSPCILCNQESEMVNHLLLACVYSREVWFKVLRRCGWQGLPPSMDDCLIEWCLQSRKVIQKSRHRAFGSLFILVCWCLWCQCNERVFFVVAT